MFLEPAGEIREHRQRSTRENLDLQCQVLEAQILKLVEDDPVGAAKSWLGRIHLQTYGFLLPDALAAMGLVVCSDGKLYNVPHLQTCQERHTVQAVNEYPFQFELGDVLLDGYEIVQQLMASEYLCGEEGDAAPDWLGPDLTPFTLAWLEAAMNKPGFSDPFMTAPEKRPDVTVEAMGQAFNLNPTLEPSKAPEQGFREVSA